MLPVAETMLPLLADAWSVAMLAASAARAPATMLPRRKLITSDSESLLWGSAKLARRLSRPAAWATGLRFGCIHHMLHAHYALLLEALGAWQQTEHTCCAATSWAVARLDSARALPTAILAAGEPGVGM